MNSPNNTNGKIGYKDIKPCARLGCHETGIQRLRVIDIGKTGLFCDKHRIELLKDRIVEHVVEKEANSI